MVTLAKLGPSESSDRKGLGNPKVTVWLVLELYRVSNFAYKEKVNTFFTSWKEN